MFDELEIMGRSGRDLFQSMIPDLKGLKKTVIKIKITGAVAKI
jgi:hypothetical protein